MIKKRFLSKILLVSLLFICTCVRSNSNELIWNEKKKFSELLNSNKIDLESITFLKEQDVDENNMCKEDKEKKVIIRYRQLNKIEKKQQKTTIDGLKERLKLLNNMQEGLTNYLKQQEKEKKLPQLIISNKDKNKCKNKYRDKKLLLEGKAMLPYFRGRSVCSRFSNHDRNSRNSSVATEQSI
jgi:hypothetical protein